MGLLLLAAMVFLIIFHLPSNKPDVTCDDFDLDDIPHVSNKNSAIVIVGKKSNRTSKNSHISPFSQSFQCDIENL